MQKQKLNNIVPQLDCETSLAAYVSSALNGIPASERGEYLCDCPQCGRKKCYVNVTTGLTHCFHADCLYSAHLAKLLQDVEGCSKRDAYTKARALLNDTAYGNGVSQYKKENETETRNDVLARYTTQLVTQCKLQTIQKETQPQCALPSGCVSITSQYAKRAVNYLRQRGVALETMLDYALQFCIAPRIHEHDRYRLHVVFPFYDAAGKLIYWTTRRTYETTDTRLPKSYHPSGVKKPHVLGAKNIRGDEVFIVEGPMDMLAFPHRAIPLLGSSMTEHTARALCKRYKSITLMLDKDARVARVHCAEMLLRYASDATPSVSCFVFVPRTDPADMMREIPDASSRVDAVQAQRVPLGLSMLHQLHYL